MEKLNQLEIENQRLRQEIDSMKLRQVQAAQMIDRMVTIAAEVGSGLRPIQHLLLITEEVEKANAKFKAEIQLRRSKEANREVT